MSSNETIFISVWKWSFDLTSICQRSFEPEQWIWFVTMQAYFQHALSFNIVQKFRATWTACYVSCLLRDVLNFCCFYHQSKLPGLFMISSKMKNMRSQSQFIDSHIYVFFWFKWKFESGLELKLRACKTMVKWS